MIGRTPFGDIDGRLPLALLQANLAIALLFAVLAPSAAGGTEAAVELRCKIAPAPKDRRYTLWKVEVRRSSGEPVRQVVGASGDTVRFKNLEPGIYILCLLGEQGRSRCQSVDLVPPPDQKSHRFTVRVEAPPPLVNQKNAHKVSVHRLAVPDKARKEMVRAEEAQLRGDREQALQHLERALEICPSYTDALNNLGTYYHRKGDYEQSIRYFTKATKIEPDFFPGWVNLGGSLLASGRLSNALEANRRALDLRPNDPLANCQLGINHFYLRNYPEAERLLLRVVSLDPYSANAPQLFLAHIAFAERQPDKAERHIRSYLELHPHSPRAPHLRRTLRNLASGSFKANVQEPNPD